VLVSVMGVQSNSKSNAIEHSGQGLIDE